MVPFAASRLKGQEMGRRKPIVKVAQGANNVPSLADGQIARAILLIRGERVILDADLARLYGVTTKRLNEQVRRNIGRFPLDFMFQLTGEDVECLRSQFATLDRRPGRGQYSKYLPLVFTEHGAIMAANVLNSPCAVQASVFVVRAFVRLRNALAQHKELAAKLNELEGKVEKHDQQIVALIQAIRQLMTPPNDPPRKPIGFRTEMGNGQNRSRLALRKSAGPKRKS